MEEDSPIGAILTGGAARRMGGRKADFALNGVMLVERVRRRVSRACRRVICVGGEDFLGRPDTPTIPDLFPGADSMGGIATALKFALDEYGPGVYVFCAACDMPLIEPALVRLLARAAKGRDAAVARTGKGFEPLCAVYSAGIFGVFEERIAAGNLRIRDVFALVDAVEVGEEALRGVDPELRSFINVNRPEDAEALKEYLVEGP